MTASQTYSLMSEEQLKAFLAKAKDDRSIQEKLKAAKSTKDVVAIAKEHGHEFTADNITKLSQEELENVSGGATILGLCNISTMGVPPHNWCG